MLKHGSAPPASTSLLSAIAVRGGSDSDADDDEEEPATAVQTALELGGKIASMLGKVTIAATKMVSRSLSAAFDVPEEDVQEEASVFSRVLSTLQRMMRAAVSVPVDGDDDVNVMAASVTKKAKKSKQRRKADAEAADDDDDNEPAVEEVNLDFGQFLARQYDVTDGRSEDDDSSLPVMGGSVNDALLVARSKARLLVAYIPAARPSGGKKSSTKSPDQLAIRSLLSPEVSKVAEKKARRSAETPGSFVLWGAKAGSPEAVAAMKRLKAKQPKGSSRPTLIVAYPAQIVSSTGVAKMVLRLLAQHHCSPPPTPDTMAAWLNALRKRHAKQFAAMHHEQREAKLFQERQEGYKSSIVSDVERREQEAADAAAQLAKDKAEEARVAALEARRAELKESLPEEPGKQEENVMTNALRFADGRAGQRRFDSSTPVMTIFNWVDAHYEIERERITLTTMNGQKSFSWEELDESQTLAEAGLGRMTGLRVIEKVVEAEEEEAGDKDDEGKESDTDDES